MSADAGITGRRRSVTRRATRRTAPRYTVCQRRAETFPLDRPTAAGRSHFEKRRPTRVAGLVGGRFGGPPRGPLTRRWPVLSRWITRRGQVASRRVAAVPRHRRALA